MTPERVWRIVGLHHVAFAHGADPATETALCRLIGTEPHLEDGPGFVERMYGVGDAYLQTLQAEGDGVVQRFLDARGPGLHHVAFTVDGIDAALEDLRGQGVRLVDERPRPGGMGSMVAFVHPSSYGGLLIERGEPAGSGAR